MNRPQLLLTLFSVSLLFSCASQKGATVVKPPPSLSNISRLYAYVPAGNVLHDYNSDSDKWQKDSLKAFLISPTEVSNLNYLEFLYSFKDDTATFRAIYPDTTVWSQHLMVSQPYMDHYFNHPAYKVYPVVGITKEQAEAYCNWLTQALAISFPNTKIRARLPTKLEWIRAARGSTTRVYPTHENVRVKTCFSRYNYLQLGDDRITYNDSLKSFEVVPNQYPTRVNDGALITTEVRAFWPNDYGLYNMSGNVSELIGDKDVAMGGSWHSPGYDIRVESEKDVSAASSTVGFRVVLEILE
jgi:formylglycine-generating enzyme required for sulfatase activity